MDMHPVPMIPITVEQHQTSSDWRASLRLTGPYRLLTPLPPILAGGLDGDAYGLTLWVVRRTAEEAGEALERFREHVDVGKIDPATLTDGQRKAIVYASVTPSSRWITTTAGATRPHGTSGQATLINRPVMSSLMAEGLMVEQETPDTYALTCRGWGFATALNDG